MKVHIEDNLYLESDDYSYMIREETGTDKEGKPTYKTHGYFSTVQSAMKHLLQMKIKQSTAVSLSELLQDVKRIEQYIESKINF